MKVTTEVGAYTTIIDDEPDQHGWYSYSIWLTSQLASAHGMRLEGDVSRTQEGATERAANAVARLTARAVEQQRIADRDRPMYEAEQAAFTKTVHAARTADGDADRAGYSHGVAGQIWDNA